ncbi:MAG TPA: M28 family peptidase [Steroidobacteraceae bacterium]|nr:M28 family peptidase [Steroidobacteraceae bacterium]
MKSRLLLAALAALLVSCGPRPPVLDQARITEDVRVLSGDDFEGRAPATAGERKTVEYLVSRLTAAGLEPGGDPKPDGGRAWTQDLPLARSAIDGPVHVQVNAGRDRLQWSQGAEVALRAAQTGESQVSLVKAPLVFVGYGVTAPERRWDDFKDVDLKGKVALILVNDPDFETGEGDFGGRAMTYYGRWTYKYEEAARRGAAGALVIHETAPASYGWETVKNSNTGPVFDVQRANPREVHVPLEGWIQRDAAALLLQKAGLDFEKLKALARTREFRPAQLAGVTLDVSFNVKREPVVSKNIMAVLPGTKHADEWVLYTAHWDHLGTGQPDADGDAIFNGAVDNAAGVAQLLEIARAFQRAPRTGRSLGFLFVGAEEQGLLGSEYYATHPLYPLEKTVADLNTDSPRPTAPARDFMTSGDAPLTLMDSLIEIGRELKRNHSPDSRPEAGTFYRSDHFSFAKRGVPAISFKSGDQLTEGGVAAGRAWREAYDKDRYHQPNDEFDAKSWRSDGIAADGLLLYTLGRRLADTREWPEWKEGSEFKAIRDTSAAQRN